MARVTGVDLEERLVRLPRTGDFGWLRNYGDPVVPVLQAIRRCGPGAARRGALLALVHLRGEAGLDAEDLAAVRRLIRIKAVRDVPYAFDACFNSWLAVEGGDQRGIMAVLGLTDAALATYPWVRRSSATLLMAGPDRLEGFAHVFISPQLNGWTVVRGPVCDPDRPQVADWAGRLSGRYGRAQAYFFGSQDDGDAWLVAEGARSFAGTAVASPGPRSVSRCRSNAAGWTITGCPRRLNSSTTTKRAGTGRWTAGARAGDTSPLEHGDGALSKSALALR